MVDLRRRTLHALVAVVTAAGLLAGCSTGSGVRVAADDRASAAATASASAPASVVGAPAATGPGASQGAAPGGAAAGTPSAARRGSTAAPAAGRAAVAASDPRQGTTAMLAGLRLVNYQPSDGAWPAVYTNWRPDLYDRDLAAVAALGANAVRVSVIPDTMGWPTPKPAMQARLAQFVDLAASHGLRVQLTLFDWFGRTDRVAESKAWAAAVTRPFRGDSRVVLAEVLNEVDPGDPRTVAFLRAVLPAVRTALPGVPVTTSISTTAGVPALRRLVAALPGLMDVADIHYYGDAATAWAWLGEAKAAAGGLPLFVGEAGHSLRYPIDTDRGVPHHEALQAVWFDSVLRAGRDRGVPIAVWMLNDLRPTAIPGHSEAQAPHEYRFGLRRLDGSLRPAAAVVRGWWTGSPPAGLVDRFGTGAGGDGLPPGWRVGLPGAAGYARDTAVGSAATGSARLSAASGDPIKVPNLFRQVPVDVRAGRALTATAKVRLPGSGAVTVALGWIDASGRYLGGAQSGRARPGTGWTTLTVTGKAPAGARTVCVYLKASGVAGSVWFDDVTVAPAA